MTLRPRDLALTLIALALFSAGRLATAQVESNLPGAGFDNSQARHQSGPPTIQVYSRETLVDVTVTDANRHPVHGLQRSDFTVEEDGKPQSIRSLHEFSRNTAAAPAVLSQLPPHTYTNIQPASGPLTVLLFDDINGGDIVQARRAAATFIKGKAPEAQIAIFALGQRLTVLQAPTSDPVPLLKVINNSVEPYSIEARGCVREVQQNQTTLDQLNQLAVYLSGIKGRKNLVWIGNGIPSMVFPSRCQDFTLPLRKTYDLLEDSEVSIYPLDPNGVGVLGGRQLTLEAVAEATGGIAFYERNDLESLIASAVESGSDFYTLSYVPPDHTYDGKYHAISIKVDRPDLHLLYRKGYSAEDPAQIVRETIAPANPVKTGTNEQAPDALAVAMAAVAPPATQILFNVRADLTTEPPMPFDPPVIGALNPKLSKAPLTRYDFRFSLAQDQIAFAAAGAGTFSGALEFDLAAYDTDGRLVTMRSQTLKLPLTVDEYRQFIETPFQFFQQLDLPPGQLTIRAGVRDIVSGKIGTLNIPLTLPSGAHNLSSE